MVTISKLWDYEMKYSPAGNTMPILQVLKIGEEYGELCSARLQCDNEQIKEELADLINACLGLAILVYGTSDELERRLMCVIDKMSSKYPNVIGDV